MKLGVVVGSPVTGDEFFDREREMSALIDGIDRGDHIMITAPRRTGKTSLLKEAALRLRDRYSCLYVDVQASTTEVDAIVKLAIEAKATHALAKCVVETFRNVLSSILHRLDELGLGELTLKLREGAQPNWRAKGDDLLARLAGADPPVVILFDELPVLVNCLVRDVDLRMTSAGCERARVFLSWLREATIRHSGRVRFVACESIGLEPLLSQAGISETMTTFTPLHLPPWDEATAVAFLKDRSQRAGIAIGADSTGRIVSHLGELIPQHVQMFMRVIYEDCALRGTTACTGEDVDRLYETRMLSVHGHLDLATYEDRLKRVVRPELVAAALELLTEAAVCDRLTPQAASQIVRDRVRDLGLDPIAELRFLLGLLTHDGYLKRVGSEYIFVSNLLRDGWRNRFSFGYIPVGERAGEGGR